MGIKHYFSWFNQNHSDCIHHIQKMEETSNLVDLDVLALDLNGIFHPVAQKTFKYGKHKQLKTLLRRKQRVTPNLERQMFQGVCDQIDQIFKATKPNKTLILCIDGVAGVAKMCLAAGTMITMADGTSKPIEQILEGEKVWGWNGKGFNLTQNYGLQRKGEKPTIKITMWDGTELICTQDHRILVERNNDIIWIEAGKLQSSDKIICSLQTTPNPHKSDENGWEMMLQDTVYDMGHNRDKTLALMRILGHLYSDGSISYRKMGMILGTRIDAQAAVDDIFLLTGKSPKIGKRNGDKGTIFEIHIPSTLHQQIIDIDGLIIGKKNTQEPSLPLFLTKQNCPISIIREFLGSLFGGDGHSSTLDKSRNSFTKIRFSQTIIDTYTVEMKLYFEQLCDLLRKVGVECNMTGPTKVSYPKGKEPKDGIGRVRYYINLEQTSDFFNNVGFRYAINKQYRCCIASKYWKMCESIKENKKNLIESIRQEYELQLPKYICSKCDAVFTKRTSLTRHCKFRCPIEKQEIIPPSHKTYEDIAIPIIEKWKKNNIVLHPKSIPTIQEIQSYLTGHSVPTTTRRIRNSITAIDFCNMTNSLSFFDGYRIGQESQDIPYYSMTYANIEDSGIRKVYDIEVEDNHSFLANGICVHNCQQRSRRFKSSKENEDMHFDPNCMTPGTRFMDKLSRYIYYYIQTKMQNDEEWQRVDVIFSNEKVPGEGEAKAFSYLRSECDENDSFCIFGLDADLIMLNLASKRDKTYVLRENMYGGGYYLVDIDLFRKRLKERMNTDSAIVDFVFICFMVGNDFLPQIPTLEIFNGGIEALLDIYTDTCQPFGLINTKDNKIRINTLLKFLQKLSEQEKDIMLDKYRKLSKYFPDPLITDHFFWNKEIDEPDCNFDEYMKAYYNKKLPNENINEVCQKYLQGMQWVIHYYTQGIPSWNWQFPHQYGPFLHDLAKTENYEFKPYPTTKPFRPFQQLLAVLPPASSKLIPEPMDNLLNDKNSPIIEYYPKEFIIDISGKRAEWEGIVVLPIIEMRKIVDVHNQVEKLVDEKNRKRNKFGHPQLFYYDSKHTRTLKTPSGDIKDCHVFWEHIKN